MKAHHWILAAAAVVLAVALLVASRSAGAATDSVRGRQLYELRCLGCHSQSVHARAKRVAADFDAIRDWVVRWKNTLALDWDAADVEDVALHLNATFYKFPCPKTSCSAVSDAADQPSIPLRTATPGVH